MLIMMLTATLTVACSRAVDVDVVIPSEGEQLVANGLLAPERAVSVSVTRTAPVVGPIQNDLSVRDATVVLFQENQPVEKLRHAGDGMYTSPSGFVPQVGQLYHLVIERNDEKLTTNGQTVPAAPVVTEVRYQAGAVLPLNDDSRAGGLSLTLVDTLPQGFYSVDVRGFRLSEEVAINVWALNEIDEVSVACGFVGGNDTFDFSTACFADNAYRAAYGVETTGWSLNGERVDCTHLEVSVTKISEDYYRYLETSVQPEGIDLAFVEPQVVFSNVPGGYGIVGAAHPITFTIEL